MSGKIESAVTALAKVRGDIAGMKTRLEQAEEVERELLRKILGIFTDESDEMESLWERQDSGDFEAALVIGQDVAVVNIREEYNEWPRDARHEAVNVDFIPLVQQAL